MRRGALSAKPLKFPAIRLLFLFLFFLSRLDSHSLREARDFVNGDRKAKSQQLAIRVAANAVGLNSRV